MTALCHDPRGGTWWEVEDVVACKVTRKKTQYLVRYKGFSEAYDECLNRLPREIRDFVCVFALNATGHSFLQTPPLVTSGR